MEVWEAPRPSSFPNLRCRVRGRLNSRLSTTVALRPRDASTFSTNRVIRDPLPSTVSHKARFHTQYLPVVYSPSLHETQTLRRRFKLISPLRCRSVEWHALLQRPSS